jgi:hypothetical protein
MGFYCGDGAAKFKRGFPQEQTMSELTLIRTQIAVARGYTDRLLASIDPNDWFRMPTEGVSHVAWQVGHLAFAQYRLALDRIRGPRPGDAALIPEVFLTVFARDSVPDPDPAKYPPAAEIRAVFDRVHRQVLQELEHLPESELNQPLVKPHAVAKTKREILSWCSHHEALHAGQIGLLRRLLGHKPLW